MPSKEVNNPSSQGAEQQPGTDMEMKLKDEAARRAMLDDLGISRIENLPLDTGNRNQQFHHPPPPPSRRLPSQGMRFDEVWEAAINSGVFNDDDAEGVRGLDDLGGGRLYDNTSTGVSRGALVGNMTMSILNQRNAQPGGRKKKKKSASPLQQQLHMVVLKQQGPPAQNGTVRRPASSTTARPNPKGVSLANTAKIPRRENISNLTISESSKEWVDPDTPLPVHIANIIYRVGVRFSSRDIDPAMPAVAVLSAAKRPEMGVFQVVLRSRVQCHWTIATWDDYFTGADNHLSVTFRDGHSIHGYQLYFKTSVELVKFITTVKDLQNGEYLHTVDIPATAAQDPAPAGAASRRSTEMPAAHVAINGRTAETSALDPAESLLELSEAPVREVAKRFPVADTSLLDSPIPADEFDRMSQATHEVDSESAAPDQPLFQKSDMLSVIGANHASDKTPGGHAIQSFRDAVVNTARTVFQFFCYSGAGGKTVTEHEFRETAEGVKSGVLQYMIQEAKQGGLGKKELETLEDAINEVLRSKVQSRLVYSIEDLLSMRSNATKPPGCLADIPYLPKPVKRQVSASSTANSVHRQNAANRQAAASIDDTQKTLSKSGSDEDKEKTSGSGFASRQTPVSETSSFDASSLQDKGLRGSRWASGTADVKHPDYFTGPKYEKVGGRSYLNDLAQLSPGVAVTTGTEDLVDLFFPRPEEENHHLDPVESRTLFSYDQGPTAAPSGPGEHTGTEISTPSKADNMETLRLEMSRLSIWSPAAPSSENIGTVAPVRPSGPNSSSRALMELCSQPASTEPTKPNGISTVKKVPRPTQMLYAPPPAQASRLANTATTSTVPPLEVLQPLMAQTKAAEHSESPSPQVVPQAVPKMRGLAASRHSSGVAPSSSGNFNFHLPR
ncbi:uncharacterized protein C8A04DRAFT_23795 [Dichotomopilus funicola]|uniref:Uncharacterized protein n=1 Tax=Dichotomopilus funicola TaxID=1934379 RepID=A0AAN6VAQ6_9PEZI|nr:hypothetical protein C8A04DRAFT_23795 [Dichotomopilus funicola]